MFKRYAQYAGGTCDPMIISWPKGIQARGEIRHQYHHVTDIVPTILELAGLEMPEVYRGVDQVPLPGVSMAYSFDDAGAPTRKHRQYYTIGGTRGIWQDGWKAAATHAPLNGKGHFDQDEWELYHVDEDRAEARNIAEQHPDKVQELIAAWFEEAHKNNGLPLDDRSVMEMLTVPRPQAEPSRERYVYYPGTNIPEGVAVNVRGRSYKIVADVVLDPGAQGVLFAHGSRFGGHSLFIKDNKLHYVYNFLGIPRSRRWCPRNSRPARMCSASSLSARAQASTRSRSAWAGCMSTISLSPRDLTAPRSASSRSAVTACASASTAPTR